MTTEDIFDEEEDDNDIWDDDDEESGESLVLSFGEDGKATINRPEDFVSMKKDEAELLIGFTNEHNDLFKEYLRSKGLLSDE